MHSDAIRFCSALAGDSDLTFQTFDDDAARKRTLLTQIRGGTLAQVWPWLQVQQAQGAGVFVTINATHSGRRKATDVTEFRALWVEFDRKGQSDKWVEPQWHLDPSVLIKSKNGLHAYWMLADPRPLADWAQDFRAAQKRLIKRYPGSDVAIHDAPRVMRLPGTSHLKDPLTPFPVEILRDTGKTYTPAQVLVGLPLPEGAKPLPTVARAKAFLGVATGNAGDFKTLDLARLFRDRGALLAELGAGKFAVSCPFVAGHTDGAQGPTSTIIWQSGAGWPTFYCAHAHCSGVGLQEVVGHFGAAVIADYCAEPYRRPAQIQRPGAPDGMFPPADDPLIDTTTAGLKFPVVDKHGAPNKDHLANTRELMRFYGWTARRNLMAHRLELGGVADHIVADCRNNAALAIVENRAVEAGLSRACVHPHLCEISTPYHPIVQWLDGVTWDGTDRLLALLDTLTQPVGADRGLSHRLMSLWLVSAVAAVRDWPGFAAQGVLMLQGPQGRGKSRWVVSLLPPHLRHCVRSALLLDPHDRDSVQRATECWIAELAEIDATFRKADRAALKAFLTAPDDTLREPYARASETRRRRTVYVGTVNPEQFLQDDEDRRYWPIAITQADADHGLDMAQVWAQADALLRAGHPWWLSADEQMQLANRNADFRPEDPQIAKLWATWEPDDRGQVTMATICESLGATFPSDSRKFAQALQTAGVGRSRVQAGEARAVYWQVSKRLVDPDRPSTFTSWHDRH